MKRTFGNVLKIFGRVITLRCPVCGRVSIAESPFRIRHHCSECRSLFKREDGFFVGAILVSVVTTELIILAACFFALLVLNLEYNKVLFALFGLAVVFPVAFYHHGWSIWLGFDHLVESLPSYRPKKVH
jgi:uncharacterized protein (DUF983 family)